MFLNNSYFYFLFNEYISIYSQATNYYLFRSLSSFINCFLLNEISFVLKNIQVLYFIYFFIITLCLFDLIESNMYSELGSRASSMSNSIQNAKENIVYYTVVYNRFRQAKITNEIVEIISSINI